MSQAELLLPLPFPWIIQNAGTMSNFSQIFPKFQHLWVQRLLRVGECCCCSGNQRLSLEVSLDSHSSCNISSLEQNRGPSARCKMTVDLRNQVRLAWRYDHAWSWCTLVYAWSQYPPLEAILTGKTELTILQIESLRASATSLKRILLLVY